MFFPNSSNSFISGYLVIADAFPRHILVIVTTPRNTTSHHDDLRRTITNIIQWSKKKYLFSYIGIRKTQESNHKHRKSRKIPITKNSNKINGNVHHFIPSVQLQTLLISLLICDATLCGVGNM